MNEIPAPRTDAKARKREIRDLNSFSVVEEVPADFARTIERELTTAREKLLETEKERDLAKDQVIQLQGHLDTAQRGCELRADGWAETSAELSRLRAENAAKDAALQHMATMPEYDQDDAHRLRDLAKRALSTTPPVCVPVEVLAKLVEVLHKMGPSRQFDKPCFCRTATNVFCVGHDRCKKANEALALAAPFLAKGSV